MHRILIALSVCFLCTASLPLRNDLSFSGKGQELDNFFARTITRINDAWFRCGAEFDMAYRSITDKRFQSQRDLEARTRLIGEDISDKTTQFVDETIDSAKQRIQSAAGLPEPSPDKDEDDSKPSEWHDPSPVENNTPAAPENAPVIITE